uniref:G_PROTEIN_RECEP_F1_2 domain-containing protein n=1 Tax=Ascaris lumbricoides TaxID=6252 RepID=A0A0M3HN52_ASCLU
MTSVYPEVIPEEYVFGIAAESIVGLVYLIASLICLVPLLLILRLFLTEKDMRHNLSYAIMFHIGILDLIQLIGHIASAVFVFSQSTFHPLVNKVLCGLCYLWGAGFTVCCLTPFASVSFMPKLFVWAYKGALGELLSQIDCLSCLPLAATTFLIYVCIVLRLTVLVHRVTFGNNNPRVLKLADAQVDTCTSIDISRREA